MNFQNLKIKMSLHEKRFYSWYTLVLSISKEMYLYTNTYITLKTIYSIQISFKQQLKEKVLDNYKGKNYGKTI